MVDAPVMGVYLQWSSVPLGYRGYVSQINEACKAFVIGKGNDENNQCRCTEVHRKVMC